MARLFPLTLRQRTRRGVARSGILRPLPEPEEVARVAETKLEPADDVRTNGAPPTDGLEVRNPATGELITTVPRLQPEDVAALADRARAAQPAWEALGFDGRARVLRRVQKWVTDHADELVSTIVAENGKTYEDAQLADVSYAAAAFGFWAKHAEEYLADERIKASSPFVMGREMVVRYAPVGVVGVIGPWNYPLTNSVGDCIPALAAGNSVLLKPASLTPMTSLLMQDGMRECGVPDDVFQVTVGGGDVGGALIDEVDFVMFTGSTETGKKVAERAARTLTPVGLELGGKDPMIVLADADLDKAASSAVFYGMFNTGQTCISVERVYVEEPAYDEFVSIVQDKVRELRVGAPGEPGSVEVGAITSPEQLETIERHVQDARAKGARILVGGRRGDGPGQFYEPTLIADADHTMECMMEETFGPTLPVMKVTDTEEAIRLANDSPYGLQSSVWTKDAAKGQAIARRIESGVCCVNDACINYVALELPMGGWKESGLGTRHGADGIRKYTKKQSVLTTRFAVAREFHMYPYKKQTTKLLGKTIGLLYGRGKR
jgi:acyl-CoA reductase-like NAD-dependent aldehyde dehydrogenase